MFAKLAFNRVRTVGRNARLSVPVTRSRNGLVAVWRREPLLGRLELRWQPAGGALDAADVPDRQGSAGRPNVPSTHRRSMAELIAAQLARKAAA